MIRLYLFLNHLGADWKETKLTSGELARAIGTSGTSLRKDFSVLGCQTDGWGYPPEILSSRIAEALTLSEPVKAGIAGLEPWGTVLISMRDLLPGITIAAGFDSSMNRLERMSTDIPLFPSYEIPEVFNRLEIKLGILSSGGNVAQQTADRMIRGGVAAIYNLTPSPVKVPDHIFTHQADIQSGILKLLSRINGNRA